MKLARLRTPPPSLAVAARAASADRVAKRREASRKHRWMRRTFASLALMFAGMSFLGGVSAPAQAGIIEDAKNLPGIILNMCQPVDLLPPVTFESGDTRYGLNDIESASDPEKMAASRKTVVPTDIQEDGGNGLDRLKKAYPAGGDNDYVISPSFQRYGFAGLRWTSIQYDCFSMAHVHTPISNIVFDYGVNVPSAMIMASLELALHSTLYDGFGALIQPFVGVFGAIFKPWVVIFAILIGLPLVWAQTRGSVSKMLSAALWIAFVMGTYLWITQHTSQVVTTANNFVSDFTAQAGCQLVNAGINGSGAQCVDDNGIDDLHNAIWRGIPYSAWQLGQVGDDQAYNDRELEGNGQIGWSQAILNGVYIGTDREGNDDEAGKKVRQVIERWNSASYGAYGGDTKPHEWTSQNDWKLVPMLTVVKFMCNDDEPDEDNDPNNDDGDGNPDDENNRWSQDNCDATGAGTASWIGYVRGEHYNHRMIAAFMGCFAALASLLLVGGASAYTAYQKLQFFWRLLWITLWLAIGAIPQKRAFAISGIEGLVSCLIKQCIGVLLVLWFAFSLSTIMAPPVGSAVPDIPMGLKPFVMILFFFMMIMFILPLSTILKAAVKNDTSVVQKVNNAPADLSKATLKFTGKAAVVLGAAALTGGTSLGAAALAGGKGAAMAKTAAGLGKVLGGGGGTGKLVAQGIKLADFMKNGGSLMAELGGIKRATDAGARQLIKDNPQKYGVADPNNPSAAALKMATRDFNAMSKKTRNAETEKQAYEGMMSKQFDSYLASSGKFHDLDPRNPDRRTPGQERADFYTRAKDQALLDADAPRWARPDDRSVHVARTGQQVVADMGVTTQAQAAANIQGVVKQFGANAGVMDPDHPSFTPLARLMNSPDQNPDSEGYKALLSNAQASVARFGVPSEIGLIGATGQTAQDFDPVRMLSLIRPLPTTGDPSGNWQDRFDQAMAVTSASAFIPVDHRAHAGERREQPG
jgi:hypothetical protein